MRSSSHVLPLGLLTALLLSQVCSGIKWLALSHVPSSLHINQTQHCKLLPGMVSSQAQLCRSNLELMQTIIQAAREVKKTCQKTFSDMRWNCSSIDIPIDSPKYRPDLDRVLSKIDEYLSDEDVVEENFEYDGCPYSFEPEVTDEELIERRTWRQLSRENKGGSIRLCPVSSHHRTHHRSGLHFGDLRLCSCGPIPAEIPEPGYRWGGCADNLHYGLIMGSKFSDAPLKMKRAGSHANKLMHLHNSEVGRQVLREAVVMKCKCHGVSGSCSIRTCWRGLQDLREIAMDLKTKYLSATKVVHRPMGTRKQLVPKDIDIRPVRENELVYLQSSPDFCTKNEKQGSVGTKDRQCNKTSLGSDSCDLMCCGRGYNPYTEKLVERCHCKYHWCCYVTCKKCERIVERYVCK